MKEWEDSFCSFNSWKGLMYVEQYRAIIEWMAGKRDKPLPPIEASIDPVNACNLRCFFCNNQQTRARNVSMTTTHLVELVEYCTAWGVKGICIAGGGEPTLHQGLDRMFYAAHELGMPISLMTNGTFIHGNGIIKAAAKFSRWIGVSVDSAKRETYLKLKAADMFNLVIGNMKQLVDEGAREVMYKVLLHPLNQYEIFDCIQLAKQIGCHGIHIRPLSFRSYQEKEEAYDIDAIDGQVMRGRAMCESERFKVFYIRHKFDNQMHRKFGFEKCLATPIMPIFNGNGEMSICVDRKNDESMVFGRHDPVDAIEKCWGSKRHKEVIENVKIQECPKCTFNKYNEQIEQAVIKNKFDYEFC